MINRQKTPPDFWEKVSGRGFSTRILLSPYNKRITVSDFTVNDNKVQEMVDALKIKAHNYSLDKIWLGTSSKWVDSFRNAGCKLEATIPGFYKDGQTVYFLSLFLSRKRRTPSTRVGFDWKAMVLPDYKKPKKEQGQVTLSWGTPQHCQPLARLYSNVFTTYPFPVFDPKYIEYTMDRNVRYITAWRGKMLVAAASAEMSQKHKNAEMTDFATLPGYRGRGLAKLLLHRLEDYLLRNKFHCLYTIARCDSIGMNKTFHDSGYTFRGVLINNCNIAGDLEDMNVWSKNI